MTEPSGHRTLHSVLRAAFAALLAAGAAGGCATAEDLSGDAIDANDAGALGGFASEGGAGSDGSGGANSAFSGGASNTSGAGNGGANGFGGFLPTAGGKANGGGTTGASGAPPSGGAPPGGGAPSGGGASSGGTVSAGGAGPSCPDTDEDGANDCVENDDGDPWTDPAIFNGVHVQQGDNCGNNSACADLDTWSEVDDCVDVDEQKDQYAGWDWSDPPDSNCNDAYGFQPKWNNCDSTWSAKWEGCIHLAGAGQHCFAIDGQTDQACASLFFDGNTGTADAQTGAGVKCFDVPAGDHPIVWYYNMEGGSMSDLHVRYCAGGAASCTPSAAIPASMLRVECP